MRNFKLGSEYTAGYRGFTVQFDKPWDKICKTTFGEFCETDQASKQQNNGANAASFICFAFRKTI